MARDKGLLTDLQIRHWIKAGTLLAKTDGNGLTFAIRGRGDVLGPSLPLPLPLRRAPT